MNYRLLFLIVVISGIFSSRINAQYENIWIFSDSAGLDFNNNPPTPITSSMFTEYGESCASVCDSFGQLLFYTDGSYVWDRSHNLMPNGSNLTPFVTNREPGMNATASSCQGTVIVPVPDQWNRYYIFSLTSVEMEEHVGKLYYSIVDINLNNGLGDIVQGDKRIFLDSNLHEKMTAVLGERCNMWLITSSQSQEFKAYEITSSGVSSNPVISPSLSLPYVVFGHLCMSPNRKKLAVTQGSGSGFGSDGLALYDFDPFSGNIYNPLQLLPIEDNIGYGAFGPAFSPDNSKIYACAITSEHRIVQFDLSSGDSATILRSRTFLGPGNLTQLRLAPDGKIYFHTPSYLDGADWLGAIHSPNLAGTAAQFELKVISLIPLKVNRAGYYRFGLPSSVVLPVKHDTIYRAQHISADCFAANVNLSAVDSMGWDYIWNNGNTGMYMTVDSPGTYWITYNTSPCNFNTDTFFVSFPNGGLPELIISATCKGDSIGAAQIITHLADTVAYEYVWSNEANIELSNTDSLTDVHAGSYYVRISTEECDTTFKFYIPEEDYKVSFTVDSIVCIDEVISFQNTSDKHFHSYEWSFDDGGTTSDESPMYTYNQAGHYIIRLTGIGPLCIDTFFRSIVVDPRMDSLFFSVDKDSICTGQAIQFITLSDNTITNLLWDLGDNSTRQGLETFASHAYDNSGDFYVTLTASFRICPDIVFEDTVYVIPLPVVNLGIDTALCLDGAPIILSNQAALATDYQYLWSNGETNERFIVEHYGDYSLTATNHNCSTTDTISIKKGCYLDIPNAFTPNGDGNNDYFLPREQLTKDLIAFRMQIFNRWGHVIFETASLQGRGWDGEFNGTAQPEGVYIYLIEAEMKEGHVERYQGNMTLMR